MQHYFTPEVGFSASYFEKLVKCMDYHDPILLQAQNEGWRKIREKSRYDKNRNEDKNEKDLWGNIPTTFMNKTNLNLEKQQQYLNLATMCQMWHTTTLPPKHVNITGVLAKKTFKL